MEIQKITLDNDLFVYQDPSLYAFGTDALLLAAFSAVRPNSVGVELCAGNGVISLLVSRRRSAGHITAVEIQPTCARLAADSVKDNRLTDRITVLEADLKTLPARSTGADFVIANPPYRRENSGFVSPRDSRAISNSEVLCTLDDVVLAAEKQLKFGGDFYCCHRSDRLCDLLFSLRSHTLEPKTITFVHSRQNDPPYLVLCHAKKGSRPDVCITAPLILYTDAPGTHYTPEAEMFLQS